MVNPFDPRTVVSARHAQHVVLVHFPVALFLAAVGFDLALRWTKRAELATVAFYNLTIAAIFTIPVMATGLLAWQWQLGGHRLRGILLLHLVLGVMSSALMWLVWWIHFGARRKPGHLPTYRFPLELTVALMVAATAHLGGFLSGVNVPT